MSSVSLRGHMVLVAIGATLVASAALIFAGYRINLVEVEEALRGRAGSIAHRMDHFIDGGTDYEIQENIESLLGDRAFTAAVVFSSGREILASTPATATLGPVLSVWPPNEGDIHNVEIRETESIAVAVPLASGGRAWVVFESAPYVTAEERLRRSWVMVGTAAILVALIVSLLIGSSVKKKLQKIRDTVVQLGSGDLQARCTEAGPSEFIELGQSINAMALNLDTQMKDLGQERSALEQQVSGRTRELEQANRLLMDIANRDALTGLANRRRLEMELARNISFSQRTGQPLAVIMMDLDKFKICNDTAGHLVGDNILRAVAATLRSRVRVTDLVVRWGGDEFCILVPGTQPQGAIAAAESLVDAVREATTAVSLPAPLEPPTASAGVACYPEDGEDPKTLILNADAALYQVKATGRGRVLRYSPSFKKS